MSKKIKILVVLGPTASGKTGLSTELAKKFNGEIISADSMQIYKGMPIASAAPTKEEKGDIPHHLFEFLDYGENFTVADYLKLARQKIREISERGRLPIVVGGTGLYISSLVNGITLTEGETDLALRKRLEKEYAEIGGEKMLEKLSEIDPKTAHRLHPNDKRRIVRAFELYYSQNTTITEQNELSRQKENFIDAILLGINYRNRETLYDRINKRVDMMSASGLEGEALNAFRLNLPSGASQAIGHKELYPYFRGEISYEEALEGLKQATRRYAKRQLTWFRKTENIHWIYADETPDILGEAIRITEEAGI